jgi:DNA-binding NtrC family response regulator
VDKMQQKRGTSLPVPNEKKKRVLVVDDDAAIRKLLTRVVELEGHECVAAENGEEALALVEGAGFDLLMADKNLPGMDGIELIRLCRELHPEMPALIITAYGSAGSALAAASQGVVDYILKPIDLTALRTRLHRALQRCSGKAGGSAREPAREAGTAGAVFAVVVVEPDEAIRAALVAALTALGHRADAFASDEEADVHVGESGFDLLISRSETLRAHPEWLARGPRWAAVVMPSRDLDRVIAGIKLGARTVLGPPFDRQSLETALLVLLLELAAERLHTGS